MSHLPLLAIVGRPNVGKSALFNRIVKKRIAIVDAAEGVTRDRLYAQSDIFGRPFSLVDTGGIHPRSPAAFNEHIKRQAEIAIEEADTLVMVVDAKVGITALDQEVAKILLQTKKPVTLAVNKIDDLSQEPLMYQFQGLGIERLVAVSAAQNWHIAELLEAAMEPIPQEETAPAPKGDIQIAIVGRPNVGKSSLINHWLKEERCIVSPIPGTTRDSIDIHFSYEGKPMTLIDTAGIRRKPAEKEVVDKFAAIRTEESIERCDVCLLMVDAQEGVTSQEKRIAKHIEETGKGCIVLLNKWDLVKGHRMEHCLKAIEETIPSLRHYPKLLIAALTGRNVEKIFPLVQEVYHCRESRIPTAKLNKFLEGAMQKNHPPLITGKRLRIYYMAQVGVAPPTFALFVNYPSLMTNNYRRYLENQLRGAFSITGVPINLYLRARKST